MSGLPLGNSIYDVHFLLDLTQILTQIVLLTHRGNCVMAVLILVAGVLILRRHHSLLSLGTQLRFQAGLTRGFVAKSVLESPQ